MDIAAVNLMSYEHFLDIFGNIIEKCPLITGAVWSKRPYSSIAELESCVCEFIDFLPSSGKEGILRCHPDLAGRELASGTLTEESQQEQSHAGLISLTSTEQDRMTLLNSQYKNKFGFPFVICAKMAYKTKIMSELSSRILNDPSQELQNGIEEVKKICHLRVQDIFFKNSKLPTKL
ncbi:putative 2-oxo-4-hydroxy-4-carboxy-5-ureidoimidazoline decarboxylase isoform X1 [Bombina bombina]|uniref:putative 2-oxo-4-hydroxy-4-carboxy-5-ureidoimidazoline decarboxylase isoform X1 n=1 Tax=Bombina bombina TaxID=8345 RepID=UPI00235AEF7D|nr:putative 2-oxo-4-hydroxy-4-carboxy-5-ureidoimidazoline decarboxylase isoform X1 [Bombina bombina]